MQNSDQKTKVVIDAELEPLVPRFIQLRYEDIQAIKSALDKDDYSTISRLGHTMKGIGASYGFDHVSEIGKIIEHAATNNERDKVEAGLVALSNYLENIDIVFE